MIYKNMFEAPMIGSVSNMLINEVVLKFHKDCIILKIILNLQMTENCHVRMV